MNYITILGIIIIAVGTFLTYYGSTLSSKKDKEEITGKIDEFSQNLESIKSETISDSAKEEKIEMVKNEFDSWASEFIEKKELHVLSRDKKEIEIRETSVELNTKWRVLYSTFFESLSQMVVAYSEISNNEKIRFIENPKLPKNIYDANNENFKTILQFNENTFWTIWLKVREPINGTEIPSIEISIENELSTIGHSWGDLSLKPYPEYDQIAIETLRIFDKAELKKNYPINEEEISKILKQVFEHQVLMIEK